MKKFTLLSTIAVSCLVAVAHSHAAVVGYVNRPFAPGESLFANPLNEYSSGNKLSSIMPAVPEGTQVALWNPVAAGFLAPSVFQSGAWSLDLVIAPGTGAKLTSLHSFTNTFVGEVLNPDGSLSSGPPFNPPPPFSGPDGIYLLSCKTPINLGPASQWGSVFDYVVGRAPHNGEQFTWLNEATQSYTTTTFGSGVWDNGVPSLAIGQSAFFNLGPVAVPEPTVASLLALAAGGLLMLRRR